MEELNQRIQQLEETCKRLVGQSVRWSRTHKILLCRNGHPLEKGEILGDSYLITIDRSHIYEPTSDPLRRIINAHYCDGCGKGAGFASPQDLDLCVGAGGNYLAINDPYFFNRKNWRTFMCCPLCDFDLCEDCYNEKARENGGILAAPQRCPIGQTFPDARTAEINRLKQQCQEMAMELHGFYSQNNFPPKPDQQNQGGFSAIPTFKPPNQGPFPSFKPPPNQGGLTNGNQEAVQPPPVFTQPQKTFQFGQEQKANTMKRGFFPYAEHLEGPTRIPNAGGGFGVAKP